MKWFPRATKSPASWGGDVLAKIQYTLPQWKAINIATTAALRHMIDSLSLAMTTKPGPAIAHATDSN